MSVLRRSRLIKENKNNILSECVCLYFSQEWIHRITDNLLTSSVTNEIEGRDNTDDTDQDSPKITPVNTPTITNIPMRSHKSSSKSEQNTPKKVADAPQTVKRRLNMTGTVPDVIRTSQFREDQEEEFFLTKNSSLFSQVSSNTLQTSESSPVEEFKRTGCTIVAVKEREIPKGKNRVVLSRPNFGVEQQPQDAERVEIIEDTESESDKDEKDSFHSSREESEQELSELLDEALEQQKSGKLDSDDSFNEYLILDDVPKSKRNMNLSSPPKEVRFRNEETSGDNNVSPYTVRPYPKKPIRADVDVCNMCFKKIHAKITQLQN